MAIVNRQYVALIVPAARTVAQIRQFDVNFRFDQITEPI
jgi:hypothetical protein